jgi:hypothetical protein
VIVEAPEAARDKRDRVWKLSQQSYRAESADQYAHDPAAVDPEYNAATTAMSLAALDWVRDAWIREATHHDEHGPEGESGLGRMHSTSLRLSKAQARELGDLLSSKIQEYNFLNRTEDGVDIPGDPDSDGDAQNYRVLLALVGDRES